MTKTAAMLSDMTLRLFERNESIMKNLTLKNIVAACSGTYIGPEHLADKEVSSITSDSRTVEKDGLFAAIKGERVDGHKFIPQTLEAGALAVLCEDAPTVADAPYILVASTLDALKAIAEYYLSGLDIPVIGITGSVGKTSTKEMIASVLAQKYNTLKTLGNFNNELGLPLTIFRLRDEHEIAVLEMGISDFGEMTRLAKIARPNTSVITNIGQCHLENLIDRDGVLRAKTEVFDYLQADGRAILNGDDDKLRTVKEVNGKAPLFFGLDTNCDFYADQIESCGLKGTKCQIHTPNAAFDVLIPIPGKHMVYNALAGTAVGCAYGLTADEIKKGIESLQSLSGRFHIIEANGMTIIDDCYNANPVSMKASLNVLQDGLGRRIAILGDMGELGENEAALHREVGEYAGELDIDGCICVGPLCRHMVEGIQETNPEMMVQHFETLAALLEELKEVVQKGDTVLVKASHFMQFERIVKALEM